MSSRDFKKLIETLGIAPGKLSALPAGILSLLSEADGILTQGESYEATRSLVSEAIKTKLAIADDDYGLWLRDIYNNDQAIYEYDGKTYQISFSIAATGGTREATLGEPKEVTVAYMPVGESRTSQLAIDYVPLIEKARPDGTFPIKIIEPGWGSSGYYSPEVLERDGAAAFPASTKLYLDHPTESEAIERPERSVRDLAATLTTAAKWDAKGADGPGLYAEAKALEAYLPLIEELTPHIGLSIRTAGAIGWGEVDGKAGTIVEKIVGGAGTSIDFVTEPGAGGKVLQLFESLRQRAPKEVDVDQKDLDALKESNAKAAKDLEETKTELARMKDRETLREATDIAAARLRTTDLPDFVQERIVPAVVAKVPLKEGAIDRESYEKAIDEAATKEAEYLSRLGGGRITGMGAGEPTEADATKVNESIAAGFGALGLSEAETKVAVAGRR